MSRTARALMLVASMFLATIEPGEPVPNITLADLPFLDKLVDKETIILKEPPPGYEPATEEADWEPIFRDNLMDDLKKFRDHVAKAGRPYTLRHLAAQLIALISSWRRNHVVIVMTRKNRIYLYMATEMDRYMRKRVHQNLWVLAAVSSRLGLQLPDTVFAHNVHDTPICRTVGGCHVPVFSMHKRYSHTKNRSVDSDVLLPHMGHSYNRLIFHPWSAKDPRALLRATMQSTMSENCVRVQLANLSSTPEGAPYLDAGFCRNKKKGFKMPAAFTREYVGITKHAEYKFLINADGHVSASRMGHIMQTNSVVLRQRSKWIEYYYRSLVEGVHVLEYTPETILPLIKSYSDPSRDGELRLLANTSQHFCAKYLTTDGKVRYAVRALNEYNELFGPALPAFVQRFNGLAEGSPGKAGRLRRFAPGFVDVQKLLTLLSLQA